MAASEMKMMFATGQQENKPARARLCEPPRMMARGAFTLIELILVMTILTIVITVAAPSMSSFFRGRTQDSEARRLLALIRYGQNRAVAEGVPTRLWINERAGTYGLELEPGYTDNDLKAVDFEVDKNLGLKVDETGIAPTKGNNLPAIRFQPDGSIVAGSPTSISINEGNSKPIWVVQTQNGLSYEIQNQNTAIENAFR
jgi:type II secretion system protein H